MRPLSGKTNPIVRLALILLGVAAITVAVYWPVLSAGAVSFDEEDALFRNRTLQSPSLASAARVLREVASSREVSGYYEPLTLISLMADVACGGRITDLRPFHRTSLALHVANTVLLILLLHQLFGQPLVAGMVGLLFGIHPLTVEPIAWVWERKTLLTTFFSLLCLIAYVRYARRGGWLAYAASLAAFALALMAKPTSTPLPAMLLLLDLWPLRRLGRRALIEKIPFVVLAAVSAVITVVSTARTAWVFLPATSSVLSIPLRMCWLIAFYVAKIVWPIPLSPIYSMPEPMSLSNGPVVAGLIGTSVLVLLLVLSLRRTRALAVGGLCFFVALLPTMGLIGYSWVVASDKYVYLPVIGLLLPLTWFLSRIWTDGDAAVRARRRIAIGGTAIVLIVAAAALTRHYLYFWQDSERLCRRTVDLAPDSPYAHHSLGVVLVKKGDSAGAIAEFRRTLQLKPDYGRALYNLGAMLMLAGNVDEAIAYYSESLRAEPNYADAHYNLGLALAKSGKRQAALAEYKEALRLRPDSTSVLASLAGLLADEGRSKEAVDYYLRALSLTPDSPETHSNLAAELLKIGRLDEAALHAAEAIRLRPDYATAHYNLAIARLQQGNRPEAQKHLEDAIRYRPDFPEAQNSLGAILYEQGRADDAVKHLSEAIRLQPDYVDANLNLAYVFDSQGRLDEAIRQYRRVLTIDPNRADARAALDAALNRVP